jgi:SAM-dependent methyltransferase
MIKAAYETGYRRALVKILSPKPDWTVLNLPCGAGTLAVTLAQKVRVVTAVDPSASILNMVDDRCAMEGIPNVRTVLGDWDDDCGTLGIQKHDIAVASRTPQAEDLCSAVLKLDRMATKLVCLITTIGDGPYDRRIFEAAGRDLEAGPHYLYNYNLLRRVGIEANVAIITETQRRTYASPDEALDTIRWMMDGFSGREEGRLKAYLNEHLVRRRERWTLDYPSEIRWAAMWWKKKE